MRTVLGRHAARALTVLTLVFAAACAPTDRGSIIRPSGPQPPTVIPGGPLTLTKASYYHLAGWFADPVGESLIALNRTCDAFRKASPEKILGDGRFGKVKDWLAACDGARGLPPNDHARVRAFFETWFEPYLVTGHDDSNGLFTGYYESELKGSWRPSAAFPTPIFQQPDDLVSVRLDQFDPSLGKTVLIGKVQNGHLTPYDSRAEINEGTFHQRAQPLLWVSDPVDAFFLHIQGSGRVAMDTGEVVRVGYAGNNGHKFVGIGSVMKDKGLLAPGKGSMQAIRDWLRANPDQGRALMAENPRYIFFRKIEGAGPIGSQGVALTPRRSLAIDPAFLPLGVPLWLETHSPDGHPLNRLMIAQDTGSAIKGPVRGDFFWGFGESALEMAGAMKSPGRYYVLLPRQRHLGDSVTAEAQP